MAKHALIPPVLALPEKKDIKSVLPLLNTPKYRQTVKDLQLSKIKISPY